MVLKRKQFLLDGEVYHVRCDATEWSYQLCQKVYLSNPDKGLKLEKFDDYSWGVYDKANRLWFFVAHVEVIEI